MALDLRGFRNALGCFSTGIVIVTAGKADLRGITVNSFASLSLEPPMLLWCIAKSSRRYDLFTKAERFAVSVLAEGQGAAAESVAAGEGLLDGIDLAPCGDGPSAIAGALAMFACRRTAIHDGGDHVIITGEVTDFHYRDGAALTFFRGRYGSAV